MEEALNQHMEQFVSTVQQKSQAAGEVLEEKKLAAGEVLGEKKQAASERLAEERMRFTKERLESITKRMGSGHRAALNRVKGFKRYGTETERKSKIRGIFHQTVKRYKKGRDEA